VVGTHLGGNQLSRVFPGYQATQSSWLGVLQGTPAASGARRG
jgi:hypothetical protein